MTYHKTSQKFVDLVKSMESCELMAYPDPGTKNDPVKKGIPWTIGYGHTKGVMPGDTCTESQAIQWLHEDAEEAEKAVNELVKVPLSQNQFDALVDFVFNVGKGNFASSTLLRKLNAKLYSEIDAELLRWNKANGKVLGGLVKRRNLEASMFDDEEPDSI